MRNTRTIAVSLPVAVADHVQAEAAALHLSVSAYVTMQLSQTMRLSDSIKEVENNGEARSVTA